MGIWDRDGSEVVSFSGVATLLETITLANGSYVTLYIGTDGRLSYRVFESDWQLGLGANVTTTTGYQDASIIALADGGFAISFVNDTGADFEIEANQYDASGNFVSASAVNLVENNYQVSPELTETANGSIVATYLDEGALSAHFFDSAMSPAGATIELIASGVLNQKDAYDIAGLAGGGIVVVYVADSGGLYAQLFDSAGIVDGAPILISATTGGVDDNYVLPEVQALANGGFVVGWFDDLVSDQLMASFYDASGALVAGDVPVSGVGVLEAPIDIEELDDGSVVFSFMEINGGSFEIAVRQFDGNGNTLSDVFFVTATGTAEADGDFVIGAGGEYFSVYIENGFALKGQELTLSASLNLIEGTDGNDNPLYGTENPDEIYGYAGRDWIYGEGGNDVIFGGTQDDRLFGGAGDDELHGDEGYDRMNGGLGDDLLDGGEGYDYAEYSDAESGVTVDLNVQGASQDTVGAGVDTLVSIEGVYGSYFDDVLIGDSGANVLVGFDGNDTITGDAGDDFVIISVGSSTVDGGDDTDGLSFTMLTDGITLDIGALATGAVTEYGTVTATNFEMYEGTLGDDSITGSDVGETIVGEQGDDFIDGGAGADFIVGDGYIYLDSGTLTMEVDLYDYGEFIDSYNGNDVLYGGDGDDTIYGLGGDDWIRGDGGANVLYGGAGFDTAVYSNDFGAVTVDMNNAQQVTHAGGADTLNGFEEIRTTRFGDSFTGSANGETFWGGVTFGSTADNNDTASMGAGDDLVRLGAGDHVADGGDDNDALQFYDNFGSGNFPGFTYSLEDQGGVASTGQGTINATGFENLGGGGGNDALSGDSNDNVIAGHGADDELWGGAGNDTLHGDGVFVGTSNGWTIVEAFDPGDDILHGGDGMDTLYVGDGDNTAYGDGGDDTLYGGSGTNYLYGGLDNDTFYAGSGVDRMYGEEGNDTFYGNAESAAVRSYGGAGDDTFYGSESADISYGQDDNDVIYGYGGNDYLAGQAGDDFVDGGTGNDHVRGDGGGTDTLIGGDGFDTISYDFYFDDSSGGVSINLTTNTATNALGSATLSGFEDIRGSLYDDVLTGDDQQNWIRTVGGNDEVYAEGGNDLVELTQGDHLVRGGEGNDTLTFRSIDIGSGVNIDLDDQGAGLIEMGLLQLDMDGFENVSGTIYDDTISGDGNGNVLAGDGGDDHLSGDGGNDYLYGDGLIYTERSFNVRDTVVFLYADEDEVTLLNTTDQPGYGVAGNDILDGGDGDDYLYGGAGDDTLIGGSGADYLDGGEGIDTADYSGASEGILIRAFDGVNMGGGAAGDTHESIENVIGTAYDDQFWGTFFGEDNIFWGGDGTDGFSGFGGYDQFFGEGGYDYLSNQWGTEYYDGGDGVDIVSYYWTDLGHGVTIDLNVAEQSNGNFGIDTIVNVEAAQGTRYDDVFIGTDGANHFWGSHIGGSNNEVKGDNNDQAYMGGGDDHVALGIGSHIVDGGDGNDTLQLSDLGMTYGVQVDLSIVGADQDYGHGTINITGIENLSGSMMNDRLQGDGGDNVLAGDAGDDRLEGWGGDDVLYGDSRYSVERVDTADGLAWDIIESVDENGVPLEHGNDRFMPGAGNDTVYGEGGDDVIFDWTGDDHYDGGDGFDFVYFSYNSELTGGVTVDLGNGTQDNSASNAGIDTFVSIEGVVGTQFSDDLRGTSGSDALWGWVEWGSGSNDDFIRAQGGDDAVFVGEGNHDISGGNGNDVLEFTNGAGDTSEGVGFTFSLADQGTVQDTGRGMMMVVGFENLTGGYDHDNLRGDDGDNQISGSGGDDQLRGGAGNDTLRGDASTYIDEGGWYLTTEGVTPGDDVLYGQGGDDLIFGDGGNDELFGGGDKDTLHGGDGDDYLDGQDQNDTLNGDDGTDQMFGGAGRDTMDGGAGADKLRGEGGGDTMNGGNGRDNVKGGAGSDTIDGGRGDDVVAGNKGNDTVGGGDGDDLVFGNDGDDFLAGGEGDDTLVGDVGSDTFYFEANSGDDFILDFEEADTIAFDGAMGLSFDDLVIESEYGIAVISWGTEDSIQVFGTGASSLDASDFDFGEAAAAAMESKEPLSILAETGHYEVSFGAFEAKWGGEGIEMLMVDSFMAS